MPFIPPMLATRLEDPRRLADPRFNAESKLGQRAQVYGSGSVLFVPDSLASSTLRPDNEIRCTSHIKAPPPVRSSPAAERWFRPYSRRASMTTLVAVALGRQCRAARASRLTKSI